MFKNLLLLPTVGLFMIAPPLSAQNPNPNPSSKEEENANDVPQKNRFWQANLPGGQYMVALDRISAISRHKYVLDGAVIVDEVTVDALGQALARFYFLRPVTDAMTGSALGNTASRIADRGRELVDRAAQNAGTDVHNMVVKKFPETTHARTIEYRVMSEEELGGLYRSVQTAWETGRGRKFTIK